MFIIYTRHNEIDDCDLDFPDKEHLKTFKLDISYNPIKLSK